MRLIHAVLLLLMGLGFHTLADWYPQVAWIQEPIFSDFLPLALTIVSVLLVALSSWIYRRDPVLVSWALLGLTGSLFILPLLVARHQQNMVDSQFEETLADSREQVRLMIARQREARREEARKRRESGQADRFAQYEGRLPSEVLDKLRALDEEMQQAVAQHANAYMTALEENPTKGPVSWIRMRTLGEIEEELQAHQYLYSETRAFTQFIESFEEVYSGKIESLALAPPADRVAIAEMERILQMWERTRVYELRKLDVEILGAAIQALNILKNNWGNWQYRPREDKVAFQNPANEAAFYEAVLNMQEIATEIDRIQ